MRCWTHRTDPNHQDRKRIEMATSAPSAGDEVSQVKTCTKCGEAKPPADYAKAATGADGLRGDCRTCRRAAGSRWYETRGRTRRLNDPGHRTKVAAVNIAYYRKNKAKCDALGKRWAAANRESVRQNAKAAQKRYRATPQGQEAGKRYAADPKIKLQRNVSRAIRRGLVGGKRGRTFEVLGFTPAELRVHLERQFKPGMTWENYGARWELDHIVPLAAHNYSSPTHADFKRAWAISNLQPLWARDNRIKGARLAAPFQPSLLLGEPL